MDDERASPSVATSFALPPAAVPAEILRPLPSDKLAAAGLPRRVFDGEIAVPDERGVTHIDQLSEALRLRRAESLAYFAFDLLHLDGHDLRPCAIEDRKALLRDLVGATGGPRLAAVDHITGNGQRLFEAVRQLGAEGIVSKRAGSPYRGGVGRDWLKTKVSEEGAFVVTGYIEHEAVAVAEWRDGELVPAGLVKFGLARQRPVAAPRPAAGRSREPWRYRPGAARAGRRGQVLRALP
jgi:ATP-dependent DNA ligase